MLLALLLILTVGCGQTPTLTTASSSASTELSTGGSSLTQETSGSGSSGSGYSTSDDTSAPPDLPSPMCPSHPYHNCTIPVPCNDAYQCGEPESPFQGDGCMRPACQSLEDCEDGYYCNSWNSHLADYSCAELTSGEYKRCACGGDPIPGNDSLDLCFPVTNKP